MIGKIFLIIYITTIIWAIFDWCSSCIKIEHWRKDHNLKSIKYSVFDRIRSIFQIIIFILIPIVNIIVSTVAVSDAVFEKAKEKILEANNNDKV